MPKRLLRVNVAGTESVTKVLDALRSELDVSLDFPAEAVAEAERAAAEVTYDDLLDRRDIPFVTIDPPGSRDLDQALHIERTDEGYLVRYAIAAVALFVEPGSALDQEIIRRGVTIYSPDQAAPLHPAVLSSGAASLLPYVDRPAYIWYHHLDSQGNLSHSWVELGIVRSRAQLTYEQVQDAYDADAPLPDAVPADMADLLAEVGKLREVLELERGGASIDIPEQRVEKNAEGFYLAFRDVTPMDGWNAQISLLTGMAAAIMMLRAGVGILRTLPPAHERDIFRLRKVAKFLGLDWPKDESYAHFVADLDGSDPHIAAFFNEAVTLFRGAGYLALPVVVSDDDRGKHKAETNLEHAAIGAPYAHVTAPLRRLVDRYGLEVCRCICSGDPIPEWVLEALPGLPKIMGSADRTANSLERRAIAAVEAIILAGREGERFPGVIIEKLKPRGDDDPERGVVLIAEPAVEAVVTGEGLPVGERVLVELVRADTESGQTEFKLVK